MTRLVLRGARWPGDVAVAGGRIVAVGSVPGQPGDQVVRVDGGIVTAGLVNTPHHFYQWLTRGRPSTAPCSAGWPPCTRCGRG